MSDTWMANKNKMAHLSVKINNKNMEKKWAAERIILDITTDTTKNTFLYYYVD